MSGTGGESKGGQGGGAGGERRGVGQSAEPRTKCMRGPDYINIMNHQEFHNPHFFELAQMSLGLLQCHQNSQTLQEELQRLLALHEHLVGDIHV